jgi:acyl-CoA thioesterase
VNSETVSPSDESAADLARRCAAAMWAQDRASQRLGMQLLDVGPGRSTLSMTVRDDMVNGHGNCHGGFVAALADSAFAFACNTYDEVTVAAGFDIVFVAPVRLGDELVADAVERARFGRSGLYDVTVARKHRGEYPVVAEFRGRSRSLGRPHLPPDPAADPAESDPAGSDTAGSDTAGSDTAGSDTAGSDTAGSGPKPPVDRSVP